MMKNYMTFFSLCYFLLVGMYVNGQVQLKVEILSDSTTYQVLLRPEANYTGSQGITNTAQVTLKVPTGGFDIGNLQSIMGTWSMPTTFVGPSEAPNFDYHTFSLNNSFTNDYVQNMEFVLFSFTNTGSCTGGVELITENDPFINNSSAANVGNFFSILGFGNSNAVSGVYDVGGANCESTANDCNLSIATVFGINERTCNGNDGTIQISASGGSGSLEYSINNGVTWTTSAVFNNLASGNYMIRVRDANDTNCELANTNNPFVVEPFTVNVIVAVNEPSCNGAMDGSITVSTNSSDNNIAYSIDGGANYETSGVFNNLGNGVYDVILRVDNDCEFNGPDNPYVFNITNNCAADTDGDGIPDMEEDINNDGNIENDDTDNDGNPNYDDNDDDGDQTLTIVEANAPNGGDGNNDGILDYLQDSVSSNINLEGNYHTITTGFGQPIFIHIFTEESDQSEADALYDYPYFLDGFIVNTTGTVDVGIIYHEVSETTDLNFRKFGPQTPGGQTLVWYDYPHTLSTIDINGVTAAYVQFSLTDNQLGDADETVGRIVDPSGLAVASTTNNCDVQYLLTENNGTYQVSFLSNVTYTGVDRTISSMQITLRAPTGVLQVDNDDIIEDFAGTTFELQSSTINPPESPGFDYFSFSLISQGVNNIPFEAGQITPLFTFTNSANCSTTDSLFLVGDGASFDTPTIPSSNIEPQLFVAGGGGTDSPVCVGSQGSRVVCDNATPPACDVQYLLTENNGTYQVSFLSNVTYTGADRTVSSMQITLRAPTGVLQVNNDNIIEDFAGTTFELQSSVINPPESPGFDYFSFSLISQGVSNIPFEAGQITPLFTFTNSANCNTTGSLFLIGNGAPFTTPTIPSSNIEPQLFVAGGGGSDSPVCVGSDAVPLVCSTTTDNCEVQYILEEQDGIYSMRILSNITWNELERTLSSMQVTLRSPTGTFDVNTGCVEASFTGTVFEVTSSIVNPSETPGFDYFSFTMTSFGANTIPFEAGDTVTIFTFKNIGTCSNTDGLFLVGDGAPFPIPAIPNNNLEPQLFAAGGGGEDTPVCVGANEVPVTCPVECPDLALSAVPANPTDCGVEDGQILVNATPSDSVIYSIDGGATWSEDAFFSGLSEGTYDVRVALEDTTCISIVEQIILTALTAATINSVDVTQPTTCDGTGNIQISTTPASGIIYSINGGVTWNTSSLFTNLDAGNYDITIANADTTCIVVGDTETLTGPTTPIISGETIIEPTGCGNNNGLIQIATTPSSGLIYSIDGGATWSTNNVFPNLGNGTYQIAAASADTVCSTSGSTTIFSSPIMPTITNVSSTNPTRCDVGNGQIQITANPNTGIIYSINGGSTWSTSNIFNNLESGNFSVRIANADTSCVVVGTSFSLSSPTVPVISSVTPADPTNCDGTNGQITINSFPVSGVIYSIDNGQTWSTNATFTNLSAGSYPISIATSDTSCVAVGGPITINNSSTQIIASTVTTDPSSPNSNDGCIEIMTACQENFEYSIDGGATYQSSNLFCNLSNGTYDVRVRCVDLSCSEDGAPVTLTSNNTSCANITVPIPNATLCDASSTPVILSTDSPITLFTITGGNFSNEQIVADTSLTFDAQLNGLINFFTVSIITESGCELVDEFVLYQAQDTEADFVVIEPFCRDGEVTIQFTGNATPNATLNWSLDGGNLISSSAQTATEPAGAEIVVQWDTEGSKVITLEVNDNGCTDDHIQSIFVRKLPLVTISPDTTICLGDCTQLESDGTGVWYTWTPADGLSSPDIPNPVACPTMTTTYTLEVMGADGCISTTQVTITVDEIMPVVTPDSDICIGDNIQLSATDGTSYSWSPATGLSSTNIPNPIAEPTQTTTYTVTITNDRGCTTEEMVTITVNPIPNVFIMGDSEICRGGSTQLTASVHASYAWSPATGLSSTTIANPIANPTQTTTYTVTVTSDAGCTATGDFTVNVLDNPVAMVGPNPTICAGQEVNLSASGGMFYEWSPITHLINSLTATPTVSPLETTTYTVVVTDMNGCTDDASVTVNIRELDVNATSNGPICPGEQAQLSVFGGGTGMLTYQWSPTTNLSNPNIANPTVRPTTNTEYCVTVTDSEGCTGSDCVTVEIDFTCVPPNCDVNAGPDRTICSGESISLSATGGFTYTWSPSTGLSNPNIPNPIATPSQTTTYTVMSVSENGCMSEDEITITVDESPFIITYTEKELCRGDSIYLLVNNHESYQWSPTNTMLFSDTEAPLVFPMVTTVYTVTVTGENGCTNSENITVTVMDCEDPCEVNAGNDVIVCRGDSRALQATGAENYTWSPSTGLSNPNIANPIASPSVTTTYTVTGTTADGCSSTDVITVTVADLPDAITCDDKTICEGDSVQLVVNNHATYAWSPTTFLLNPTSGVPIAFPSVTTTYTVTVTNEFGCTDTDQVVITVDNCDETPPPDCTGRPIANAGNDVPLCSGGSVSLLATGGVSYQWSPVTGLSNPNIPNPMASPTQITTYTVTVTDIDGCTDTDEVQVLVALPIATTVTVNDANCCGQGGGSIFINASGGFGNITYNWSQPSLSGNNVTNINAGNYTVTITDAQGCTAVENITVGNDCSDCTPIFDMSEMCADPGEDRKEVCLPIPPDEIEDYIVMVDGIRVFPDHGCAFENLVSYSYVLVPGLSSTSSFRVDSWTVNGQTFSIEIMNIGQLTNWMNAMDPNGAWSLNTTTQTVTGGLPTSTYGPIQITDLTDWTESTLQPSVTGVATGTSVEVDVSDGNDHEVVVENPITCCRDTLIVRDCTREQPCLDNVIAAEQLTLQAVNCDAMTTFCIEIPTSEISNYTISQNGVAYTNVLTDCVMENGAEGTTLRVGVGMHEFIFENGDNGCQDRLLVEVSCLENIMLDTTIEVGQTGLLCLNTIIDAATINTTEQTCLIGGNDTLDIEQTNNLCWQYTGLTEGTAALCLEVCTTDGLCRTVIQRVTVIPAEAVCQDIVSDEALSMILMDCTSDAEFCLDIPFDSIANYEILLDGTTYSGPITTCTAGINVAIPKGNHTLHFRHIVTNCTDEVTFKIDCTTNTAELSETILLDASDTLCITGEELSGPITRISNFCPGNSGTIVTFEIDEAQNCIYFTGNELGSERACIVFCDDNGICDTINLTVFVVEPDPLLPEAVSDSISTRVNVPVTLRVIDNDNVNGLLRVLEMTTYPRRGEATMNMDNTITYTPEINYCDLGIPESFEYRICNEDGCDTAVIKIGVPCEPLEVKTGLSPNGDGVNDVFFIQGLQRYPNNELQIFNRWGSRVFSQQSYKNDWGGTFDDQELPSGTYFYLLTLGDGSEPLKGYLQIQR